MGRSLYAAFPPPPNGCAACHAPMPCSVPRRKPCTACKHVLHANMYCMPLNMYCMTNMYCLRYTQVFKVRYDGVIDMACKVVELGSDEGVGRTFMQVGGRDRAGRPSIMAYNGCSTAICFSLHPSPACSSVAAACTLCLSLALTLPVPFGFRRSAPAHAAKGGPTG